MIIKCGFGQTMWQHTNAPHEDFHIRGLNTEHTNQMNIVEYENFVWFNSCKWGHTEEPKRNQ